MPDSGAALPGAPGATMPASLVGGQSLYFSGEDGVQLTALNAASNVVIRIAGRFLPRDGARIQNFARDVKPTTDRTTTTWWVPLGAGWLLDVSAFVITGTPQHGQCWVRLAIVRGGPSAGMETSQLSHGYITTHRYIGWPLGIIEAPLDGPGALRSITGTQPGAGANLSETVPTGARWEIVSVYATFTTSATVATRVVSIIVDDGTNNLHAMSPQQTQTASQSIAYSVSQVSSAGFSNSDNKYAVPLPEGLRLGAGFRFRSSVNNLQAGDQFGAPQLLIKEWMAGE